MYLLGQAPEEPDVVQDRKVIGQGALLAGLLIAGFWAWLKSRPKVTFKSGYPKVKKNPRRRRRGSKRR